MSGEPSAPRSREACIALMLDNWQRYHSQPPSVRVEIDRVRWVPVPEVESIFAHFVTHGHCPDEILDRLGRPSHRDRWAA